MRNNDMEAIIFNETKNFLKKQVNPVSLKL